MSEALDYLVDVACADKAAGTRAMYEQKGRNLIRVLGDVPINKLTRDDVARYAKARLAEVVVATGNPTTAATVQKELIALRRALTEAHERGLLVRAPGDLMIRFAAKYRPRDRYLGEAEFARLLGAVAAERTLWVALAVLGGLRLSEVERLQWDHVDLVNNLIRVPGTKTVGAWRMIGVAPALRHHLEQVAPRDRRGAVAGRWKNVRRDLRASIDRLNREDAARAAERGEAPPDPLPRVTPNDLRRTFATWLKRAGVDSAVVASLMGHGSTKMVDLVYGKIDDATRQRALDRMPASLALPPAPDGDA